jgi:hypothetical protein
VQRLRGFGSVDGGMLHDPKTKATA